MSALPRPHRRRTSNWSAIWVLPLIALCIGGWLAWRSYDQAGIDIEIFFPSGDGIQAGKTEVFYKGMALGKVTGMTLDDSGAQRGVRVAVEFSKHAETQLRTGTRFWLVKPSVSLAGITGLETLVSGNYIAVSPGAGEPQRKFTALPEAPPLADSAPGLHLTLKAERLGSLSRDAPVYHRQIQVGRVKSYQLGKDQRTVEVQLFIEPEYASLVRKHTRFWNASGVTVDAGLSGVKLRTESLASIVAGGIAFATPEHRADSPPTDPALPFRLYDDFDAAQAGIRVQLQLGDFDGLEQGRTPVVYRGMPVGSLKSLKFDEQLSSVSAELSMDPRIEDVLSEGAEFWLVKPSVSLAGITGLEALVKGNYIAMRPGERDRPALRHFVARAKAPPLDVTAPGLHMVLFADALGSLDIGSPILYRQVKVGSIQSYQFSRDQRRVVLGAHIEPEYAGLVNGSTRFWNVSGLTLKGGLTSGLELRSESLQTLMAGGITFETPDARGPAMRKVPRFTLHADREQALQEGVQVRIRLNNGDGLNPGTAIRYKGIEIGKVEQVSLSDDLQHVWLEARLLSAGTRIARSGSRFWVVRPELGLLRTANLDTLVSGPYLDVQPDSGQGRPQHSFTALEQAPAAETLDEPGLRLVLSTARRGSLKPGVQVSYREVPVGKVLGYRLGDQADRVLVDVLIEARYAPLVHSGSRFWNASGIGVDAGLFKGVKVRTESLEALLEGGIAFATPDGAAMGRPALPGQTFALHDEVRDEWLGWAPKIPLR